MTNNMKTTKRKKSQQYESEPTIKTPKLPSEDEIRRRAHQLSLERGGLPGKELDDWLQAERELKYGSEPKTDSRT
jgi:hypothetical protein